MQDGVSNPISSSKIGGAYNLDIVFWISCVQGINNSIKMFTKHTGITHKLKIYIYTNIFKKLSGVKRNKKI